MVLLAQLAEQAGGPGAALEWLDELEPSPELVVVILDTTNRAGDHDRVLRARTYLAEIDAT